MKKIPTVFERVFENGKLVSITPVVRNDLLLAFEHGDATIKWDGSCVAIIKGELYKRFDFKPGRVLPENAIPCQDAPDEVTGHFPHWVKCDRDNKSDKWFWNAYDDYAAMHDFIPDGTYEAIGKSFNGNPYGYTFNTLIRHGLASVSVERSFIGIRDYLKNNPGNEGLVFWYDGKPVCKIKRTDFGYSWNNKGGNQ